MDLSKKLVFLFLIQTSFVTSALNNNNKSSSFDNNIEFDTADLTHEIHVGRNSIVQLQAFRSIRNDEILHKKMTEKYAQLQWFSIGYPRLVIDSEKKFFRFTPEGFTLEVSMLTNELKLEFVDMVKQKYLVNVSPSQIVNIVPSEFNCSFKLDDAVTRKKYFLAGRVKQFTVFPLEVHFDAPEGSKERILFEERIKWPHLKIACHVGAHGKLVKTNKLEISASQMINLDLFDDLFGPSSEVYVTRQQMADLASTMYSNLHIEEDYEMTESAFSSVFIDDFLKQTATLINKYVPLKEAIAALSRYNMKGDLEADVTNTEYKKIMRNKTIASKIHNILSSNESESSTDKNSVSFETNFKFGKLNGTTGVSFGANGTREKSKEELKTEESLEDMLEEINREENNTVEWKFEGERLVAKSLKVSRLLKSNLLKTISLTRVRRQRYENKFNHPISISTAHPHFSSDLKFDLEDKFEKQLKAGLFVVAKSEVIEKNFDVNGSGKGNYRGWFLCDGRNGTPDLRGRVLVGADSSSRDYNTIGQTGGQEFVKLSVDQLPAHTHNDSGHSHSLSGRTSEAGNHFHYYKDIFFSEYPDVRLNSRERVQVPDNLGEDSSFDHSSRGQQMDRTTELPDNEQHKHEWFADVHKGKSNLASTGGNEEIENRQPYFVVAFICSI